MFYSGLYSRVAPELLNCGFRDDTTGANVGATTINAIFRSYFAPSDVLNLDSVATSARCLSVPKWYTRLYLPF
jgi:hypothetical protein